MNYQVIKVFNNNVILASQNDKEMILVSKGIGFGKKQGDNLNVDIGIIEKVFYELSAHDSKSYLEMIPRYDEEVVGVSEEIIAKAEIILGQLSPNIHTALIDHITFALDRIHMELPIENPFTEEIIMLYQEEYDVAELAASLLKERLRVDIGEDEKGFIALHLHSARNNKTIRETMRDTRIFKSVMDILTQEIDGGFTNRNNVYQSFIPNMKIMLNHCKNSKVIVNPLKNEIKKKMKKSYDVAKKIGQLVAEEQDIMLTDDMLTYIAVDIEKIRQF